MIYFGDILFPTLIINNIHILIDFTLFMIGYRNDFSKSILPLLLDHTIVRWETKHYYIIRRSHILILQTEYCF